MSTKEITTAVINKLFAHHMQYPLLEVNRQAIEAIIEQALSSLDESALHLCPHCGSERVCAWCDADRSSCHACGELFCCPACDE